MTRVTNAEQALLLLRDKLARSDRSRGSARPGGIGKAEARPLDRLRAMSSFDAMSEDDRRRAVVHSLLVEELGDGIANDAGFQSVLDDIVRIIAGTAEGAALIDRASTAIRHG